MEVGLMADTHDHLSATERAIDIFNDRGVDHVLHAGDLVSPFVASKFGKLGAELHYVWGNNEGDRAHISSNFAEIGVRSLGEFGSIELGGRRIALLHGICEEVVEALAKSGIYDAVVRGHTHRAGIQEDPLVINPGEVCGYLSGRQSIAILDTEEMRTEILEI